MLLDYLILYLNSPNVRTSIDRPRLSCQVPLVCYYWKSAIATYWRSTEPFCRVIAAKYTVYSWQHRIGDRDHNLNVKHTRRCRSRWGERNLWDFFVASGQPVAARISRNQQQWRCEKETLTYPNFSHRIVSLPTNHTLLPNSRRNSVVFIGEWFALLKHCHSNSD